MTNKMTPEEMAALEIELRDKRRAHVEYECGKEGIVALVFEVEDTEEGRYYLTFHHVCYTAALEDKLKRSPYWAYWMKEAHLWGGAWLEDDPHIKRGPGAFPKGDGEIDDIEQDWIRYMAINLMEKLQCDVIAHLTTRGSYPFGRVPYEFLLKEPS